MDTRTEPASWRIVVMWLVIVAATATIVGLMANAGFMGDSGHQFIDGIGHFFRDLF